MSRLLTGLSVSSLVFVIIATALTYTSFFTSNWLSASSSNTTKLKRNFGLWDNGLQNLNCDVTPFSICMYTRAGVFASMVLNVPSFLFALVSTAVVASGGNTRSSATLARSSAIMSTIAAICHFIGVLLYTLQHTTCIVRCPPTHNYYSDKTKDLKFGFSFYLAWVALPLLIAALIIQFVFASAISISEKEKFGESSRSIEHINTHSFIDDTSDNSSGKAKKINGV
uniref:Uncharacterized protein n=1 Tax=Ciona savignyi TaxID=51511 RepID=H2YW19_CIOSA